VFSLLRHVTKEEAAIEAGRPGNLYNRVELAGAFGDLGTLIPFVLAYVTILGLDPVGVLLAFGVSKVLVGLYYRTPIPVQPMKVIGSAAVIQAGVTPGMVYGAGLITGLVWLILGATGLIQRVARLCPQAVTRGIVLGLGFMFMLEGIRLMAADLLLAVPGVLLTYALLSNRRLPAMFVLLVLGAIVALVRDSSLLPAVLAVPISFKLPFFPLAGLSWDDLGRGALLLALPQIPLTLGNAVIAITAENNALFPQRRVSEREVSLTTGGMNLLSAALGGVPLCHGAGGMAGHVRFGARTGGALVMLGLVLVGLALFFSETTQLVFQAFPSPILGVVLFFAGLELAATTRADASKSDFHITLLTAALATFNMAAAFVGGILLYHALRKKWTKL